MMAEIGRVYEVELISIWEIISAYTRELTGSDMHGVA